MAEWGLGKGKSLGLLSTIFKKTADDATLRNHMIDDIQNVIHRFLISKYRCSHAYYLLKLELLQFASDLLHFALLQFITFCVKSDYILGYQAYYILHRSYYILGYYYIVSKVITFWVTITFCVNCYIVA